MLTVIEAVSDRNEFY
jgi:propionyl-CoA carboxylase beta chain